MYGLSWILLAAQIACCTCGGASAGAAAVPSGSSLATAPGDGDVGRAAAAAAWAPVRRATGRVGRRRLRHRGGRQDQNDTMSDARANARRENKPYSSFVGLRG